MREKKYEPFSFSMTQEERIKILQESEKRGMAASKLVRKAVEEYLNNNPTEVEHE